MFKVMEATLNGNNMLPSGSKFFPLRVACALHEQILSIRSSHNESGDKDCNVRVNLKVYLSPLTDSLLLQIPIY